MEVIGERAAFRAACRAARRTDNVVGLVPTMGALHEGHRSLLDAAREATGFVAMTLFVNPLQFGDAADLRAYPRPLEADLEIAERAGVDVVFHPSVEEMYPAGEPQVTVDAGPLGERLEGASRPGHFRGVLTVVAKLLSLTGPCRAFFGEKDAQQLALIRRMVTDLELPATIVSCPTVREADGLALSSRNARLTPGEREAAPVLWRALSEGRVAIERGEREAKRVRDAMAGAVDAEPLAQLDYSAVVDEATWEDAERIDGPVRLLLAARFGATRLIDNVTADPPGSPGGSGERGE